MSGVRPCTIVPSANEVSLREYRAKRDFRHTREPAGGNAGKQKQLRYVIQKHAASHLHYDFRLEMGGVLKSWAVPKGLPTRRAERHLAIEVEDHPLEYGSFEGTIPAGNYGAGTVMLWDRGTYTEAGGAPLKALDSGKLHLKLVGSKLSGEWTLIRLRQRNVSSKPQWLVLKTGPEEVRIPLKAESRSVLSGRSMEQIARGDDRQWTSNRGDPPRQTVENLEQRVPSDRPSSTRRARPSGDAPRFVEPMKALLAKQLPRGPGWIYELKFDGVRALGIKNQDQVRLLSRANQDLGAKYPNLLRALSDMRCEEVILDGEIVAVDPQGRPSFQLLQSYQSAGTAKPPLFYYVFDILRLDGRDLKALPLLDRKKLAADLVGKFGRTVRFSGAIKANSERVMREMQKRGLEGLIAKKADSRYEPGRRSGAWVKFKWTLQQEFVIGGFTEPKGGRSHFGAILVGYYEQGELRFAGKVGTGFDSSALGALAKTFKPLVQSECPFLNLPENQGLTRTQMRHCTWLKPRLVCEVRFSEWTRDGRLRQPAFLGMRDDKQAREVVREASN